MICKLNEELNCSIDFNTLSEIEIFNLFLEYKLSNLDIEKKKFESSNSVGINVTIIAISILSSCVLTNASFSEICKMVNKLPVKIGIIGIILIAFVSFIIWLLVMLIFYCFLIKTIGKNNDKIVEISEKCNDIELIYKLLKNKYKEHINHEKNN